jgi:hypothetical protein
MRIHGRSLPLWMIVPVVVALVAGHMIVAYELDVAPARDCGGRCPLSDRLQPRGCGDSSDWIDLHQITATINVQRPRPAEY